MREIELGGGLKARVSDEDYERVSQLNWTPMRHSRRVEVYAQAKVKVEGKRRMQTTLMHRFIMGLQPGDPLHVDHKDHDGLNNTRENLRVCTRSQNTANQKGSSKKGLPRGVQTVLRGENKHITYYMATIRCPVTRKRLYLGTRKTVEDAHALYRAKHAELHGEFSPYHQPQVDADRRSA